MLPEFNRIKGIHPGVILKRELDKRNLKSIELARDIQEYPQTINAITNKRRGVNSKLSIKLGRYFNIENEYFMLLQVAFEINQILLTQNLNQNNLIGKIRSALFWDVDINKMDWNKNKRFIIKRIFERGNQKEIEVLIQFYGLATIQTEIQQIKSSFIPNYSKNIAKYLNNGA